MDANLAGHHCRNVWTIIRRGLHPDTLAEVRIHFDPLAVDLGHRDVDLSTITSGRRSHTQRVARYVYEWTDSAGSPAFAGMRYVSRRGAAGECWALFADRLGGERLPVESVRANDPGVIVAARHLRLTI